MPFDDDLLAELDELGGDFQEDMGDDTNMDIQKDHIGDSEGESNGTNGDDDDIDASALDGVDLENGVGDSQQSIINKLASKSSNIKKIAKVYHSTELKDLLSQIAERQEVSIEGKEIIGRVEDDPEYRLMVKANEMSSRIANETLVVHQFILDHYSKRFPELETLVQNPIEYARTVQAIGSAGDITKVDFDGVLPNATRMVVTVTGSTTTGALLTSEEQARVEAACECLLGLFDTKLKIVGFIESRMPLIAPNLTAVIGSATAAKLIVEAGGITALSKIPSCNIQVLGKSHANLTGLSAISDKRNVGIVYYSDVVRTVPEDFRKKMMRKISAKCALAARVDSQHGSPDGAMGRKFRAALDAQVEKLLEAAPVNAVKPLPIPDEGPKKRRGGRKVRKGREPYTVTELRKQRDRLQFGTFQEEVVVMDEMEGLGMLGKSVGHARATQANTRTKPKVAKKYDKYLRGSQGSNTSGIASLAFTPVQGFELANPQSLVGQKRKSQGADNGRNKYFASNTPFLGKRDN